jgi:hypothetical protein
MSAQRPVRPRSSKAQQGPLHMSTSRPLQAKPITSRAVPPVHSPAVGTVRNSELRLLPLW